MNKIKSINKLKSTGSIRLSYPDKLDFAVNQAVKVWKKFCSLPENIRIKFEYNKGTGMGVGYEIKKTPGNTLDLKEDFHFTSGMKPWLEIAAKKTDQDAAVDLVHKSEKLVELLKPFILEFSKNIETEYGLFEFQKEVLDSSDQWFIRFIHYFGNREVGDEIASSHADKCGFTLHLYESDPGLQFLNFDFKWHNVKIKKGQTIIIPGMRLQYRSKNILKALFHRVVANKETSLNGRFSLVCFIHLKRTPQYNKQGLGRLQEFKPGFNYEMKFDEFAKLFIQ